MSDAAYKPNNIGRVWRMKSPPDKMRARDGTIFNPNAPAPADREPVKDMRPGVLLAQLGGETAEEVGNAILARQNGDHQLKFGDEGDIS